MDVSKDGPANSWCTSSSDVGSATETRRARRLYAVGEDEEGMGALTSVSTEGTGFSRQLHSGKGIQVPSSLLSGNRALVSMSAEWYLGGDSFHLSDMLLPGVSLHGHNNTWFRSDGLGTFYTISDTDGQVRYNEGTMCAPPDGGYQYVHYSEDENMGCVLGLPPGVYKFRVTGAEDPNKESVGWTFCGATGEAQQELLFEITDDCECEPLELRGQCDLGESCKNAITRPITHDLLRKSL